MPILQLILYPYINNAINLTSFAFYTTIIALIITAIYEKQKKRN